ncbi:MAG: hypothetical protein ACRDL0_06795 [Thermoleophilaceae bacterium]
MSRLPPVVLVALLWVAAPAAAQLPAKPEDVLRVEKAVMDLAEAKLVLLGGNEGYAAFFAFGHSLRG